MRKALRRSMTAMVTVLALAGSGMAMAQNPQLPAPSPDWVRKAPAGAPNVVLVLLDDVGFGASSTFGGVAQTPALDQLARDGLRYNRFHTTAICSPTRSSLLTGRNPHATGIGAVMNSADSRPGYSGFHTKDTSTIAEVLRQNGYSTAMFGKWHQTPDWEVSPSGPFDRWPTGEGFEKFYGFQGGETDQFEPSLFDGTTPVMRPAGKGYHLTQDLVDHSINWIHTQKSVTPDKPFFLYLAPGGTHAPIQVPQEYIDRYKGKFDQGWDKLREEIFAREKQLGVIPKDTKLTPRPAQMPAWDSLTADQKKFAARTMEAYAGFLAHTDEQVGRLVTELKAQGLYDNTLFIYIVGDNGASAEGGLRGSLNYMGQLMGMPETDAQKEAGIDRVGSERSYTHYNTQWAWANNAPFQWTKTVASHLGGIRNAMVMSWPKRITDHGGLRSQFGHVNDIAPTILEAAGIKMPDVVNGIAQKPLNGTSLVYSFSDPKAPERHTTQYFEVYGHRSIYHNGWMASAMHDRLPWQAYATKNTPFDQDKWELYDLTKDFSQATDLAAKNPQKLEELKALFTKVAGENQVLPLAGQKLANGLPNLAAGMTSMTYHAGTIGIPEKAMPFTFNRAWTMTANLVTAAQTRGVVATMGGSSGGWSLYIDAQRRPVFTYRNFEVKTVNLVGQPLPDGASKLEVRFDPDGPGYGKGGTLKLLANGAEVGSDSLPLTSPGAFSINETFDVGLDTGSAAGFYPEDAAPGFKFEHGELKDVTITLR